MIIYFVKTLAKVMMAIAMSIITILLGAIFHHRYLDELIESQEKLLNSVTTDVFPI